MNDGENARLDELERRLAAIEAQLARLNAAPAAPPPPATEPARPAVRYAMPSPPPPREPAAPPRPRADIETAFGLTWLSRIAVLTIVLALAFFFKYAFENHWITEWGRVLLGAGAGLAGLAMGERFWRVEQRTFGHSLTAAGIVFLYLSCWAAFGLYHLIPQAPAFALMILVTAAAGALALRYDSAAVAAIALAGGFATPLLLGATQEPWSVFGYAVVLDAGASFAARRRGWRWCEVLSLAGTVALYMSQWPVPPDDRWVYSIFVLAWYGLFAMARFPAVFAAAQILASLALVHIWEGGAGALVALVILSAAGLVAGDRRRWRPAAGASFAGFWLAFALWSTYQPPDPPVAGTLALLTAAFLLFLAWPLWQTIGRGERLRVVELLVLALNAPFYFGAGYALLHVHYSAWEGLFAVALAVAQMAAARALWEPDSRGGLLAAGAAWVLLVLAAPIQFAGYRITIAWAAEAAAIAWIGVRVRDSRALSAALGVFLLVWLRLLSIDSSMYPLSAAFPLVGNARLLTFAVSAAAFAAAAWWIRQGWRALAAYLSALVILLWGFSLEAVTWAARTAAPQDFRSVASTAISVLAAAYAVLLVGGGVAARHAVTRLAGIALIALVVLKLYLYDVWLLGQFYRMAAFAILGALLLAMSYLYSRFRGSIGTWWRPGA